MKSYFEYIDEIDENEIFEKLLRVGLFSAYLPPVFTMESFYKYCCEKRNNTFFEKKDYNYVYYESMRNINIPRQLGVPVPMAYYNLCKCISNNWNEIKKHFDDCYKGHNYKVSRIHIRKNKQTERLFNMNYTDWRKDGSLEPELSIGKRYIVNADISTFFPSIYSHSLPWALVGKNTAKSNRNQGRQWYNKLDNFVRGIKYGETHGLLIGPDASSLLSEIILAVVDKKMIDAGFDYVRNIDDYICFVENEEKAEKFISTLQNELRYFDLNLNHKKTKITKLPEASTEHWIRKINTLTLITNYGQVDYKHCRAYLDYSIDLFKAEKENAAVIKYAIKTLSGLRLTNNARKYEEDTVFQLCYILPYLIPLLEEYVFKPCGTKLYRIKEISNLLYKRFIKDLKYEAISYTLYFAIKYGFLIETIDAQDIINTEDCVVLLLAYKYFEKFNYVDELKKIANYSNIIKDMDFDKYWLFLYEVLNISDLSGDWKVLKQEKVTFFINQI